MKSTICQLKLQPKQPGIHYSQDLFLFVQMTLTTKKKMNGKFLVLQTLDVYLKKMEQTQMVA